MTTKTCTKCGETKPTDRFSKDGRRADGLQRQCKECQRAYREANRERIAERARTYYEVRREERKAYLEANRDKIAARNRAYYEANRDKIANQRRAYRKENQDKIIAYREANRDKIADYRHARHVLVGDPGSERSQEVTARYATRTGDPWTPEEDRHLLDGPGTILDKALQLSRTYSAIKSRAHRLRQDSTK